MKHSNRYTKRGGAAVAAAVLTLGLAGQSVDASQLTAAAASVLDTTVEEALGLTGTITPTPTPDAAIVPTEATAQPAAQAAPVAAEVEAVPEPVIPEATEAAVQEKEEKPELIVQADQPESEAIPSTEDAAEETEVTESPEPLEESTAPTETAELEQPSEEDTAEADTVQGEETVEAEAPVETPAEDVIETEETATEDANHQDAPAVSEEADTPEAQYLTETSDSFVTTSGVTELVGSAEETTSPIVGASSGATQLIGDTTRKYTAAVQTTAATAPTKQPTPTASAQMKHFGKAKSTVTAAPSAEATKQNVSTPSKPNASGVRAASSTPKTGDTSGTRLYGILSFVSAAVLLIQLLPTLLRRKES